MTKSFRRMSIEAVFLVLLLFVLLTFVNGLCTRVDLKDWGVLAGRAVFLAFGVVLYRLRPPIPGDKPRSSKFLIGAACLLVATSIIAPLATLVWQAGQASDLTREEPGPAQMLLAQVFVGPAGEELVFTGFLYSTLRQRAAAPVVALCVGLLFVVLHLPPSWVSALIRLTYILAACALFERFRSIFITIALHIAVNGALLAAVILIEDPHSPIFSFIDLSMVVMALAFSIAIPAIVVVGWRVDPDARADALAPSRS